jgi:hypothetical protein
MDRTPAPGRKFGYVIAIAMNAVGLWVARHLLEWGWPRFLTDEFDQLLPILTVSFVAGMVVNGLFVLADPPRFKALCNAVTSVISVVVAVRTWQVFPFDFSTYAYDWTWVARVVIALAAVGSAIAVVANLIAMLKPSSRGAERPSV